MNKIMEGAGAVVPMRCYVGKWATKARRLPPDRPSLPNRRARLGRRAQGAVPVSKPPLWGKSHQAYASVPAFAYPSN